MLIPFPSKVKEDTEMNRNKNKSRRNGRHKSRTKRTASHDGEAMAPNVRSYIEFGVGAGTAQCMRLSSDIEESLILSLTLDGIP